MADRYVVIGNPVEHSRSPAIHAAFAKATGEPIVYERLLAPLEGFRKTVDRLRAEGVRGANITLPFKGEAFEYADELADRARRARAVNTLRFDGERVFGDNTDGAGIVLDLERNLGVRVAGRSVLIAGAGGATRGVVPAMLDAHPAGIVIANRTLGRAEDLAIAFGGRIVAASYSALEGQRFDLVINATSASLLGELPPLPQSVFADCLLAYDMMYGTSVTPFLDFARELGARRTADGLGMLVEQAAESFFIWRGVRPATAPVLAALRAAGE